MRGGPSGRFSNRTIMLEKDKRLRKSRDFALLSQNGRVVYGPLFTLRFRKAEDATKVGFVASTKIFKRAADRNRAKRRLRAALRALEPEWPKNFDLLFIAKRDVITAEFSDIKKQVKRSFEQMPEVMKRPPQKRKPRAKKKSSVVYKNVDR